MTNTAHRFSLYACLVSTLVCCGVILSARALDSKTFTAGLYGSILAVLVSGSGVVATYRD